MGRVELGRVVGAFGIHGWIRVRSITRPPQAILEYGQWQVGDRTYVVREGRPHGALVAVQLEGVADRDAAQALTGATIEVERSALPKLRKGQFYWADLMGASVETVQGETLGVLSGLTSNGVQDVMQVRGDRERLIPYVSGPIVKAVDPVAKRIVVDWQPDY
ncbi:MAG TPA: ribosome maturation factor RimM [Candidatus Binatia bacterium]|nr:ribosome maturation factor RimM [Candidatus Binatia bacterium]